MRVRINSQPTHIVSGVNTQSTNQVVSVATQGPKGDQGIQGPIGPAGIAGIRQISLADDVDTTVLEDGSVLVYSTATSKWTSTKNLDKQILDAGHY